MDSFVERAVRRLDDSSPAQYARTRKFASFLASVSDVSSLKANMGLTSDPPSIGQRYERSFTVPDEFIADNEWDQVDRLLDDMPKRETLGSSRALFGFQINHGSETERDTPSPPRGKPPIIDKESFAGSTRHAHSSQTPVPRTPSPPSASSSVRKSKGLSPRESFAQHEQKRRQTQLATPKPSSPPLDRDASPHVRVGTISDLANISFQEPSPSNQAAASQLASSQTQLNISFYSSPTVALEDIPSRDQEDDAASLLDTEVWGSIGSAEYADDADDEWL
ncbi:hypothetical protein E8E11_006325 [Didymella keratinophila]|nr:hypothetical protein E8E11_006325 [Didymella keratinophila]